MRCSSLLYAAAPASAGLLGSVVKTVTSNPLLQPVLTGGWTTVDGLATKSIGGLAALVGLDQTYDVVVVGGGTGGNTLAYRLAEAGHSVAVIEAGLSYEVTKPVLGAAPLGDIIGVGSNPIDSIPTVDFGLKTVPQAGANNREMHYTQGKCLGGSSALNFMIHHRPTKGSMDRWADNVGDQSYTFDNLLPYFKKSFTFRAPDKDLRLANATTVYDEADFAAPAPNAPIEVTYPSWTPVWSTFVAKAFETLGLKLTSTFNKGELNGFHYAQTTIKRDSMVRSTSADFIHAANARGTKGELAVYLATKANKVVFDKDNKATGVEVNTLTLGKQVIKARKQVVLSAGAVHTPQLLMLSGIGPADHLKQFGIQVRADRPGVGQNMSDHALFGPAYEVTIETLSKLFADPVALAQAVTDYGLAKKGPLTSNVAEFIGWERMPASANISQATRDDLESFPKDWPHIEYFAAAGYIGKFEIPFLDQPKDGKMYASMIAALAAPLSRGSITLGSANPLDAPLVNPNWLTHPADVEVAIAMYRRMRDIFKVPIIKSVRANDAEYWPGDDVETDEEILAVIRASVMSVFHASCTARMGRKDDPTAVTDSSARVIGVDGLRVVDASSMALLPAGHPQALIYAVAEKIAEEMHKEMS
jgi:choline dehydrogenase